MKPLLVATLLLWAVPAYAAEAPCTIREEGPSFIITCPKPTAPPIVPPIQPPLPPPPIVPPITDNTPFVFPAQPQRSDVGDPRYYNVCDTVGFCYVGLPESTGNLPPEYRFACFLPAGTRWRGTSLGGMRLWVPPAFPPAKIRTLCAGGAL